MISEYGQQCTNADKAANGVTSSPMAKSLQASDVTKYRG